MATIYECLATLAKPTAHRFERQQYLMLSCQSTAKVDDNMSNALIVQCATSFMFHCEEEGDPSINHNLHRYSNPMKIKHTTE